MSISRRQFLKTKGALLALPFLPSLASAAVAKKAKPSKKLVFMYVPNGLVRRTFFPGERDGTSPGFKGGFSSEKTKHQRIQNKPGVYPLQLTSSMKALEKVKNDITLVTGLDRPFLNGTDVHAQASSCYLTSVSPEQAKAAKTKYPQARSLDQIIGDQVGHNTVFKTLEISCNGFAAPKESIYFNNISWYKSDTIAPSIKDPKKLYNRLFAGDDYRAHVDDVTSLILADAKTLSGKLGKDDRDKFSEFVDMIRNIEIRIEKLQKMLKGSSIKEPASERLPRGEYIRLMGDQMLLALQMGITNVSTFMVGPERWDANLMYEGVFPKPVQHHNMTHNQKGDGYLKLQKIDIFHLQQYAYLVTRMKSIKESDGTSMYDNAIFTYGAGLGDGATHQFYDLPMIVAGKAQGQIKQGRFLQCKSGTYNANMWYTIAKMMGTDIKQYAECNTEISGLWA
jgi:hypothetical protein